MDNEMMNVVETNDVENNETVADMVPVADSQVVEPSSDTEESEGNGLATALLVAAGSMAVVGLVTTAKAAPKVAKKIASGFKAFVSEIKKKDAPEIEAEAKDVTDETETPEAADEVSEPVEEPEEK